MIYKIKSHHFATFISLFVGLSFIFERYLLLSPALIGPVALLSWLPVPFAVIKVWGFMFVFGALAIFFAWTPTLRAIFLSFGMATWAVFAVASLYQSWFGPNAGSTGSLLGIVLLGLVFRFWVAIRDVVVDFTKPNRDVTIDA